MEREMEKAKGSFHHLCLGEDSSDEFVIQLLNDVDKVVTDVELTKDIYDMTNRTMSKACLQSIKHMVDIVLIVQAFKTRMVKSKFYWMMFLQIVHNDFQDICNIL